MVWQMKFYSCVTTIAMIYVASASYLLGDGLTFKDDATAIEVRLDISGPGRPLEFGEIDEDGYRSVLRRIALMKQLRELSVIFLNVPDGGVVFPAGTLKGLSNLTSITISNFGTNSVRVTSIATWKNLPIECLGLNYLDVEDASLISEFKRLAELHCTTGELLRNAPSNLRLLDLKNADIRGCVDLGRFTQLECLHLCQVKCSSVRGLGALSNLESLSLHDIPIGDLTSLKACKKLKHLEVRVGKVSGYDFRVADLADLPLECVVFEDLPLVEIRGLERCPLIEMRVNGALIEKLQDICRLRKLERLDIVDTKIDVVDKKLVKERFPSLATLWYSDSDSNPQCISW